MRDLQNRVVQEVRIAWLDAKTSYQCLDLTGELLNQAAQALELAQSRYDLGLSSIVELSQAQLNKTSAEISSVRVTTARFKRPRSISRRAGCGEVKVD